MDLRRFFIAKPYPQYIPITRSLTGVTSTAQEQHHRHFELPPPQPRTSPETSNHHLLKSVSFLLSNPSLDTSKCKPLLSNLCPHEFDRLFLAVRSDVNPQTALHFFDFASNSLKFRFNVRSYCLLIRLLLFPNILSPARLILIRLIDGKMPVLFANNLANRHVEIASTMVHLNVVTEPVTGVRVADLLIHVYITQFNNEEFGHATEVFSILASKGIFPSLKTCKFLLTNLIRANKVQKAIEVFRIMYRGVSPDVYLFGMAINVFCKGKRIEDALGLITQMEKLGVVPDVTIYNTILHCLCNNGKLDEALNLLEEMRQKNLALDKITYTTLIFGFCRRGKLERGLKLKEDMIKQGIQLSNNIYSVLLHGLCNTGKFEEAIKLWDESKRSGLGANVYTYGVMIDGMCKLGLVEDAQSLFEEMKKDGVFPNVNCYNALLGGYCKLGQMNKVGSVLQEMASFNIHPDKFTYTVMMYGHRKLGDMKEAAKLLYEMAEKGIVPDFITYNVFTNGNRKKGNMEEAFEVCDHMPSNGLSEGELVRK